MRSRSTAQCEAMAARRSELDRADKRPIDPSHPLAVYMQLKSLLTKWAGRPDTDASE